VPHDLQAVEHVVGGGVALEVDVRVGHVAVQREPLLFAVGQAVTVGIRAAFLLLAVAVHRAGLPAGGQRIPAGVLDLDQVAAAVAVGVHQGGIGAQFELFHVG
jgi:hypothetical protein